MDLRWSYTAHSASTATTLGVAEIYEIHDRRWGWRVGSHVGTPVETDRDEPVTATRERAAEAVVNHLMERGGRGS